MNVARMVDQFHRRPGGDCRQPAQPTVAVPGAFARLAYLQEELDELRDALEARDVVAAADALADIVYLAYGAAWRFAIPLDPVIVEVHDSNMTKTPTPGDGKALKGPGYRPPDVAKALQAGTRTPSCTGVAARWCPVHGDCACPDFRDLNWPQCPLHASTSSHATERKDQTDVQSG